MRIDVAGSAGQSHWVELRDVSDLTGADEEGWDRLLAEAREKHADALANLPAGAPEPSIRMPPGWTKVRQDDLLASLITAWSFSDPSSVPHLPLPYSADARLKLPLPVLNEVRTAVGPHIAALNGESGPKEPPAPTSTTDGSGSSNGSKERSENGPPVSVTEVPETAST